MHVENTAHACAQRTHARTHVPTYTHAWNKFQERGRRQCCVFPKGNMEGAPWKGSRVHILSYKLHAVIHCTQKCISLYTFVYLSVRYMLMCIHILFLYISLYTL